MPRIPDRSTKLIIRLAVHGCKNRPIFHLVVCKNRMPRNGPCIEKLGYFDPLPNKFGEKHVAINVERFKYNLAIGAEMTQSVEKLLGLGGLLPIHPMVYIEANRIKNGTPAKKDTSIRHWNVDVHKMWEEEKAQKQTEETTRKEIEARASKESEI